MALTMEQLYIVEVFCTALLHGVYCVLILIVLSILMSKRSITSPHKAMFGVAAVMFLLATAHLVLVLIQALLNKPSLRRMQAAVAIATIHVFLGDSVLIWRVWVVWSHNLWISLAPIAMLVVGAGFGFAAAASVTSTNPFSTFTLPTTALTAVNTVICTTLIAGRIMYIRCQTAKLLGATEGYASKRTYTGIILLLIESGALYTAAQIVNLILIRLRNPGLFVVLNMLIPLIGILPTLIIILVHLDVVPGSQTSPQCTTKAPGAFGALRTSHISFHHPPLPLHSQHSQTASHQEGSITSYEWTRNSMFQIDATSIELCLSTRLVMDSSHRLINGQYRD